MPEFKRGDIVRHTGKFLRSISMFAGAPINGQVVGVKKMAGRPWPVVEWSDNDNFNNGLVNPANIELDPRYARRKRPVHFDDIAPPVIMYSAPDGLEGLTEKQIERLNKETTGFTTIIKAVRKAYPTPVADRILARMQNGANLKDALYATERTYGLEEIEGQRYKRPPRVGTRVRFTPNPASLQLYSSPPDKGEEGEVTTVAGPHGRMSSMRGPGGGLVYVDWDESGPMGVSLYDIEKA